MILWQKSLLEKPSMIFYEFTLRTLEFWGLRAARIAKKPSHIGILKKIIFKIKLKNIK
ncbi:hypothetical protein HpSP16_05280 [Helicobacter pylori]|nr:hypothetical protein VN1154_01190 [Helicobacter pylori]